MITITVFQDSKKNYTGFQVIGHAGYAVAGKDIICASVSLLTMNTLNAIEVFTEDKFTIEMEEKEGFMACRFYDKLSAQSALLLNAMILGLKSIQTEKKHRKYINIIFEEV